MAGMTDLQIFYCGYIMGTIVSSVMIVILWRVFRKDRNPKAYRKKCQICNHHGVCKHEGNESWKQLTQDCEYFKGGE